MKRTFVLIAIISILLLSVIAHAWTVTPTGVQVELKWTEPTQNNNDTPLTDLKSVRIYDNSSGVMVLREEINASSPTGGGVTTKTVTIPLAPGVVKTVHFYVTAVNTAGLESLPSLVKTADIYNAVVSSKPPE
jgi:hypothetical protein